MTPYAERRERVLSALGDGVAVIPSAQIVLRNNDTEFEFRQDSDFFYLTGFDEPDAVLVLAPQHEQRVSLFLRERDRTMETWNGHRVGVERAPETLGVDAAHAIGDLAKSLPPYLYGARTLYYNGNGFARSEIAAAIESAREHNRRSGRTPDSVVDPSAILHGMRVFKRPEEIATMRRAGVITAKAHVSAMRLTQPGLREYDIQAVLEYEFRRGGAQRTAYQSIVAAGDNATILHYRENRDEMRDGQLLLVDAGCELDYYSSDVTRTWPVNGRFSPEQRAIYEIVLAAQHAAIAEVRPGNSQRAFHDAAVKVITQGLIDLGILTGSADEVIEKELYKEYYMHGTGHWLGMDTHDVGRYRDEHDNPLTLMPGMVTTVEPGIYIARDAKCDAKWHGIGVRIEDDLLVTNDGHENLTEDAPKTIADIEEFVGE